MNRSFGCFILSLKQAIPPVHNTTFSIASIALKQRWYYSIAQLFASWIYLFDTLGSRFTITLCRKVSTPVLQDILKLKRMLSTYIQLHNTPLNACIPVYSKKFKSSLILRRKISNYISRGSVVRLASPRCDLVLIVDDPVVVRVTHGKVVIVVNRHATIISFVITP